MHTTACNRVNDPIVGHAAELSVDTGTKQIDRWIVASDTISWNDDRVVVWLSKDNQNMYAQRVRVDE